MGIAMTDTDIRVQLAKKLEWKYREPRPPWVGYWIDPIGNPTELPSLYDLVQQGEERLTEEQQQLYCGKLLNGFWIFRETFPVIRLSNLPERAKALCEVLP